MISLRRYIRIEVESHLTDLQGRIGQGSLDVAEVSNLFETQYFRDAEGDFWRIDFDRLAWQRHSNGELEDGEEPPEVVETHSPLTPWFEKDTKDLDEMLEVVFQDPKFDSLNPAQLLERLVEGVSSAYARGEVASTDAEEFLREQYLLDLDGSVWTIGVRSGKWYVLDAGLWSVAGTDPDPNSFLDLPPLVFACDMCGHETEEIGICSACGEGIIPSLEEGLNEGYFAAVDATLVGVDSVPERVAQEWNPPSGRPRRAPAAEVECSSCHATIPPNSRFCSNCGEKLE
jgi:hypothetical protein